MAARNKGTQDRKSTRKSHDGDVKRLRTKGNSQGCAINLENTQEHQRDRAQGVSETGRT